MTLKGNINLLADNNGVPGETLTADQIKQNESFFVELEVGDFRENATGVIGLALDLEWDASVLEALDTEVTQTITESLPLQKQGTINNENGLIDDLGGGAIPAFNFGSAVGINQLERFALLRFKSEVDSPTGSLNMTVADPGSVAFADGMPFEGSTELAAVDLEPDTPISAKLQIDTLFWSDNDGVPGEVISSGEVGVNDSFFVELKVADVRENPAGIIGLALDIEWDASVLEALNTEITDNLPLNAQGTIDNESGAINALGAGALPSSNFGSAIGINEPERFALLRFQGEIATDDPIPLTITVSDSGDVAFADGILFNGETDIEIPTINIVPPVPPENVPPILVNEIENVTTPEDSEFSLTIAENTFTDADAEDSLTYSATLANGNELPDWLSFDADTRTFSGTPLTQDVGNLEVEVTATDNSGAKISDRFTLTVEKFDDPPFVANQIADVTVNEDADNSVINLKDVFSDTDNDDDAIIKTVSTNDNEALVATSINGNNLILDYQDNQFGTAEITIEGESNGETVTDTFTVKVNPVDDAPTVVNAIANITVDEDADNSAIDLSDVFTDIDNNDDAIIKTITANRNDTLVSASINGNNLTLDYLDNQSGTAEITVEAESNGKTLTDTFIVEVNSVNDAPVVSNEIADLTILEGNEFSFTVPENTFTDADAGDSLTISTSLEDGSQLPNWLDFDADTQTFSGTPLTQDVGSLEVEVTATDNSGEEVSDRFTLTVEDVTSSDALIAIADSSGNADDASIQFGTPLSQWREGLSDSDLIRPNYPDTQQYIDITNTGLGLLNISEININADGVTVEPPSRDILINRGETQRLYLSYAPDAAEQNFSIDDGLTIISNAVNSSEMFVSLSGKSTFDSDITYDGLVSFGDLGPLNAYWGSESSNANFDATADINGDGVINGNDVEVLDRQWNQELTFI